MLIPSVLLASAFVAPLVHRSPASTARHGEVVARDLAFVASLDVATEPFAESKPLGEWFAEQKSLEILMSQAESTRRLDGGDAGAATQKWEVATPIQFPGMVARSETAMEINIDAAEPKLSISSAESKTTCEGGPPWAKTLLARIGDIAKTKSCNVVSVRDVTGGKKQVVSSVELRVELSIPTVLIPPFVPAAPFERAGSDALQSLLDKDMAPVLARFREGYIAWAKAGVAAS